LECEDVAYAGIELSSVELQIVRSAAASGESLWKTRRALQSAAVVGNPYYWFSKLYPFQTSPGKRRLGRTESG
jgi:hypothetical protein